MEKLPPLSEPEEGAVVPDEDEKEKQIIKCAEGYPRFWSPLDPIMPQSEEALGDDF